MLKAICLLGFVLTFVVGQLAAEPIKVHPDNPHYYLFNGKPTILITSAEHYGAVVNKDFDYVTYFDALKSYGLELHAHLSGLPVRADGKVHERQHAGSQTDQSDRSLGPQQCARLPALRQ